VNQSIRRTIANCLPLLFLVMLSSIAHAQWTPPTPEELKMTTQPEVPGAAAVYLFREEITDDKLHMWSVYIRLKVLTERGKDFANVELKQYEARDRGGVSITDIQGRTIHPDGTIIPFTGKPFEKLIEKSQGFKEMAKVFTLPDVGVGSIIEYRYKLRYDDSGYIAPDWFVQSDLYTRKAHYLWRPTSEQLISTNERGEHLTNNISWTPILPKGFEVKQAHVATTNSYEAPQTSLELSIHDVPPAPDEEYMPPFSSLSYRVLFYYSAYSTVAEYWKNEGKGWSKIGDKFIGPGSKVKEAVNGIVAASDTDEQKLRKIYAAIMTLDNTNYSRGRSTAEEKAQGLGAAKTTDDIWERKRGTDDQIAELFVAMARAAGMKAYLMAVSNRDRNVFNANYLSFNQLDDNIAIVTVNGKEQFFDPGQRYCAYGHLAWKHTMAGGLRQIDGGSSFAETPSEPYTGSRTLRTANLTMDAHGEVTGTVKMSWLGAPALHWRQNYLRGDATSLKNDLRTALERLLPGGMDIKVTTLENLENYEQPLTANFEVKGAIGSPTGKRLLIPSDVFQANEKPTFPHEKRQSPVFFEYANVVQDGVRINFPSNFSVESLPAGTQISFKTFAVYVLKTESTPTNVTIRREMDLGNLFYKTEEYPDLRAFYNQLETKDQEPLVLKAAASAPAGN
jgi:Domain of Unknown Function with PDB structure (DUF3857)/Transglutaminase-like superfamily